MNLAYSQRNYETLKIIAARTIVTLGIAYGALTIGSLENRCEHKHTEINK